MLIPFGVPVHAEGAGIIPAGMFFFPTVLVCTGFGKSRHPRDFTARERKTTRNQTFPRKLCGWERDIKISSGTVWMGSRERHLHGNGKKKPLPVKSCGKFPAGIFPRKALLFLASVWSLCVLVHQLDIAYVGRTDRTNKQQSCPPGRRSISMQLLLSLGTRPAP